MITVGNVACKFVTHKKDSAVPTDSCLTGGDASDRQLLTKEGFHEHIMHARMPLPRSHPICNQTSLLDTCSLLSGFFSFVTSVSGVNSNLYTFCSFSSKLMALQVLKNVNNVSNSDINHSIGK